MNNLAAERVRRGLSQFEAAGLLGVSQKTLVRYEANPIDMPGKFLDAAINLYGCSADYLLGLSEERLPHYMKVSA